MRFALLCFSTKDNRVRRYVKNLHGKVWMTHEAELLEVTDDTLEHLEAFRNAPDGFCLPVNAPGEATV